MSAPAGFTVVSHVTPAMRAWAVEIEVKTRPGGFGEIFYKEFDGRSVAAIVEHHSWTTNAQGEQIPCPAGGCHGVTLYHPPSGGSAPGGTVSPSHRSVSSMEMIFLATTVIGLTFTIGMAWFREREDRNRRLRRHR